MGDIFFGDTGLAIFAYLKLPDMPSTLATCAVMQELTKKRIREILAVARTLNAYPLYMNLRDVDFLERDNIYMHSSEGTGYARITAFTSALRSGALGQVTHLDLRNNNIGDAGLTAIATASGNGVLANLVRLDLDGNRIGDSGVKAFASAVARGSLGSLGYLYISQNALTDAGMVALSDALRGGALPSLRTLFVDDEHPQLKAVCEARGIAL